MSGPSNRLVQFFKSHPNNCTAPHWVQRLMLILLCCYPFIGARFLPMGDSGRYLSVIIGPIGLIFLTVFVRSSSILLLLNGIKKLAIWLPFFIAFGVISWIHQANYDWSHLFQKWCFAVILYACAIHLKINHQQLIKAAAIGAWLYFLCALFDMWTYQHPEIFQLKIPRHLTERGLYRIGGGGGNPIHFADACMWLTGICALGFLNPTIIGAKEKWFVFSASVIVFLVCLSTQSRGALLALLPLFVLLTFSTKAKYRKLIFIGQFFGLCLAFWLATQTEFFHRIKRVFFDFYYYLTEPNFIISSVSARVEMWRISLVAWQEHLFWGTGISNIKDLITVFPSTTTVHPVILLQPHFHNDWIQSISLGGLLLLLGLLSTYALLLFKSRKDIIRLWIILAAFCFGLSDLIMYQNTMLTFFISTWALFSASYDNQKYSTIHTNHS